MRGQRANLCAGCGRPPTQAVPAPAVCATAACLNGTWVGEALIPCQPLVPRRRRRVPSEVRPCARYSVLLHIQGDRCDAKRGDGDQDLLSVPACTVRGQWPF